MDSFTILLCALSSISLLRGIEGESSFNVLDYGAVGDGKANDSMAFYKAWNDTCSKDDSAVSMVIAKGNTFLVYPAIFQGPCKSPNIAVLLYGSIVAPEDPNYWKSHGIELARWLDLRFVDNLLITGGGLLDGRGKKWWDISCRYNPKPDCNVVAPNILNFANCKNLKINKIYTRDSGEAHLSLLGCENVSFELLNLLAPESSPNTDGIRIKDSHDVLVQSSIIATGDDCVNILGGTYRVNVTYVTCGPGHGVSIGSLGENQQEVDEVHDIYVREVNFFNTTNGARIKTWTNGRGQVYNVNFSYLNFSNVDNPIMIDQHYGMKFSDNGIQISNVAYSNMLGTSTTKVAINLNCSENVPCTNIELENINLSSPNKGREVLSSCNNAYGSAKGTVIPKSCLK